MYIGSFLIFNLIFKLGRSPESLPHPPWLRGAGGGGVTVGKCMANAHVYTKIIVRIIHVYTTYAQYVTISFANCKSIL
jgi:hypothetical protein